MSPAEQAHARLDPVRERRASLLSREHIRSALLAYLDDPHGYHVKEKDIPYPVENNLNILAQTWPLNRAKKVAPVKMRISFLPIPKTVSKALPETSRRREACFITVTPDDMPETVVARIRDAVRITWIHRVTTTRRKGIKTTIDQSYHQTSEVAKVDDYYGLDGRYVQLVTEAVYRKVIEKLNCSGIENLHPSIFRY